MDAVSKGGSSTLRRGSWRTASAGIHLLVSVGTGVIAGLLVGLFSGWVLGALVAWVVAAGVFLAGTWFSIWPMNPTDTEHLARREDPSRPVRDLVLLVVAVGSLLTVGLVIFRAHHSGVVRLILGVICVAASWAVLHTIFTLKYARLFYTDPVGGVDFKQEANPTYRDFAYVGFTVGMTFQVSDTDIQKDTIRATILRHALVSFLFGAVIISITINLVAGLSK
jgi:uncharacterized membrane protein